MNLILGLFSLLDYGIYWLNGVALQVIFDVAKIRFFSVSGVTDGIAILSGTVFEDFASRIYIILGVLMLFRIMISCLQYLVNPEKMDDKENGMASIFKRVIITVALLAFVPDIFNFAYSIQESISEFIPRIIMGTKSDLSDDEIGKIGEEMSYSVWRTWITAKASRSNASVGNFDDKTKAVYNLDTLRVAISDGCNIWGGDSCNYNYTLLLPTITGGFMLYVFVSMILDVAIRTIKFGLLQVLAPIPIASYIDPKSSSKSFNAWVKTSINVYCDLFIRFIIIYFVIFFVKAIIEADILGTLYAKFGANNNGAFRATLVLTALILGLLMFAKSAPKFITDLLGLEHSDQFKDMFSPKRYGMLGAAAINPIRTAVGNVRNDWKNTKGQDLSRRIRSATKRGAGGLAKGAYSAGAGIANHEGWNEMNKRYEGDVATSGRRSAKAAIRYFANQDVDKLTESQIKERDEQINKLRTIIGGGMDASDLPNAREEFGNQLNAKNAEIAKIQQDIASGTISDPSEVSLAKERIGGLQQEVRNMNANKDSIIADMAQQKAVARTYDNEVANKSTERTKIANRIGDIDKRLASGLASSAEVEALNSERSSLVATGTKLTSEISDMMTDETRNKEIATRTAKIGEIRTKVEELNKKIENPEKPTIRRVDSVNSAIDKFFGGSGITGSDYISVADTLKENRGSLWSGEAMNKLTQNPQILEESGGQTVFKSNIVRGKSFDYAKVRDDIVRLKNGTLSDQELQVYGGAAQLEAIYTDVEKSAATEYINLAQNGTLKGGNTTVTEALKRMRVTIDNAHVTKEEKTALLKEFDQDPGGFLKRASDRQERLRTKGSSISAYNSGKKE